MNVIPSASDGCESFCSTYIIQSNLLWDSWHNPNAKQNLHFLSLILFSRSKNLTLHLFQNRHYPLCCKYSFLVATKYITKCYCKNGSRRSSPFQATSKRNVNCKCYRDIPKTSALLRVPGCLSIPARKSCMAYHSIFVNVYHFYKENKGYGVSPSVLSIQVPRTLNIYDSPRC